jgi:hypothetical protein
MFACQPCAENHQKALRSVVALLCVLPLVSCGFRQSRIHAEQGVREFHALLDKEKYEAIYDASDDSLKKAWTRADFTAYLKEIHSQLGNARKTVSHGFQINASTTQGTEVALAMDTSFDFGTAQERFVWRLEGNRAVLLDYRAEIKPLPIPNTARVYFPGSKLATTCASPG